MKEQGNNKNQKEGIIKKSNEENVWKEEEVKKKQTKKLSINDGGEV